MYIKRNLEDTILKYLKTPEIIAVVGPRQSGKTTMINHLIQRLEGAISVSFDDQTTLNMFERATDDFMNAYVKGYKYLFIDEFQYAKNGGKILKYIFDSQKINPVRNSRRVLDSRGDDSQAEIHTAERRRSNISNGIKIIVSGSSVLDLTVRAVKFLVGRILVFNLYPFDFYEFLLAKDKNFFKICKEYKAEIDFSKRTKITMPEVIHKKLIQYYEEYIIFGGYPRVVIEENYDFKKDLLRNIYNTYFLREVRDILGLIDDYKLNNLIKGLALQIGNLIQYEELSRLSGYSYSSLKKYLNFLEKTYICQLVKPFYKNKRIEIVKNPKVYFFDTGLRNVVVNDFRKLDERPDKGVLLENGLAMQFIKKDIEFNFWRDKKKNELDFILSLDGGKKIAVESKSYYKDVMTPAIRIFKKTYPEIEVFFAYQALNKKVKDIKGVYPAYLY